MLCQAIRGGGEEEEGGGGKKTHTGREIENTVIALIGPELRRQTETDRQTVYIIHAAVGHIKKNLRRRRRRQQLRRKNGIKKNESKN